jgi:hypothetical protein
VRPLEIYVLGWALTAAWELVRMWRKNLAGEMSEALDRSLSPEDKVQIGEAKLHMLSFLLCLCICSAIGTMWPIWISLKLANLVRGGGSPPNGMGE